MGLSDEADVVGRREVFVLGRRLGLIADLLSQRIFLFDRIQRKHRQVPGGGFGRPDEQSDERGFPSAVRPQQAKDLPAANPRVDPLQRLNLAEGLM